MDQNILTTLAMVALMFAVFYLLILRPQKKRQAEQKATLESLQPGSRVLTSTGIYATLVRMGDKQAVIELSPGHQMTVVKHAIVRVVDPADEDAADDADDVEDADEHGDVDAFAEPTGYVDPADTPDEAWSADAGETRPATTSTATSTDAPADAPSDTPADAPAETDGDTAAGPDAGRRPSEG